MNLTTSNQVSNIQYDDLLQEFTILLIFENFLNYKNLLYSSTNWLHETKPIQNNTYRPPTHATKLGLPKYFCFLRFFFILQINYLPWSIELLTFVRIIQTDVPHMPQGLVFQFNPLLIFNLFFHSINLLHSLELLTTNIFKIIDKSAEMQK